MTDICRAMFKSIEPQNNVQKSGSLRTWTEASSEYLKNLSSTRITRSELEILIF